MQTANVDYSLPKWRQQTPASGVNRRVLNTSRQLVDTICQVTNGLHLTWKIIKCNSFYIHAQLNGLTQKDVTPVH